MTQCALQTSQKSRLNHLTLQVTVCHFLRCIYTARNTQYSKDYEQYDMIRLLSFLIRKGACYVFFVILTVWPYLI